MTKEEGTPTTGPIEGMFSVFIDPVTTAKAATAPGFWVWPVILVSIGFLVLGYMTLPTTLRVMEQGPPQGKMTPEQYQSALPMIETVAKVITYAIPVFIIGFTALGAWLTQVMCMMLGAKAKFKELFSFMAACSLISLLGGIAGYIVVRAKGDEIQTQQQMTPAFGLDIFLHDGLGAAPLAILNFFSIFEVWYLIVLTVGVAFLAKTSKGKAFLAITPAWFVPLLFKILGALQQAKQ